MRAFAAYSLLVQQGFTDYVRQAADEGGKVDLAADRAGYTEVQFQATDAEFDAAVGQINQAIAPLLQTKPSSERKLRKLVTITHPIHS